jgi:uncharacterized damage-inducible protein DinB
MSRATQLANHIERTVTGPMWHGPALADVLAGVTAGRARQRPVAGAHSIWELVLHITVWADIARQRIKGQATGDPTPEQDWPPVTSSVAGPVPGSDPKSGSDPASSDPAETDWRLAVERLGESHRQLAADVRLLDDAQLDALVPGLKYSVSVLLSGVVEHGTYHGGQIALLKKA